MNYLIIVIMVLGAVMVSSFDKPAVVTEVGQCVTADKNSFQPRFTESGTAWFVEVNGDDITVCKDK